MTEIKFICEESTNEFLEVLGNKTIISFFITKEVTEDFEECLGVDLCINDAKLLIKVIQHEISKIEGGDHE